jgi:hypothetical protein
MDRRALLRLVLRTQSRSGDPPSPGYGGQGEIVQLCSHLFTAARIFRKFFDEHEQNIEL